MDHIELTEFQKEEVLNCLDVFDKGGDINEFIKKLHTRGVVIDRDISTIVRWLDQDPDLFPYNEIDDFSASLIRAWVANTSKKVVSNTNLTTYVAFGGDCIEEIYLPSITTIPKDAIYMVDDSAENIRIVNLSNLKTVKDDHFFVLITSNPLCHPKLESIIVKQEAARQLKANIDNRYDSAANITWYKNRVEGV